MRMIGIQDVRIWTFIGTKKTSPYSLVLNQANGYVRSTSSIIARYVKIHKQ